MAAVTAAFNVTYSTTLNQLKFYDTDNRPSSAMHIVSAKQGTARGRHRPEDCRHDMGTQPIHSEMRIRRRALHADLLSWSRDKQ